VAGPNLEERQGLYDFVVGQLRRLEPQCPHHYKLDFGFRQVASHSKGHLFLGPVDLPEIAVLLSEQ